MVFAINKFFVNEKKKLQLENVGRNKSPSLAPGQWVEILDDSTELWGQPGIIALIEDVDPASRIITLNKEISGNDTNGKAMVHPKVRRWDMTSVLDKNKNPVTDLKDGIKITPGEIELESGIFISFDFDDKEYKTGDYWLIPARTESALNKSGNIEWPQDDSHNPMKLRPQGIKHHYCSLALVEKIDGGWKDPIYDCRPTFPALTDLENLFYISGDGQEAMPGNYLPEPIQAGVSNGRWPVNGVKVKFEIISEGGGSLGTTKTIISGITELKVPTVNGVATCYWKLGDIQNYDNPVPPEQKVKATLLDADEKQVHLPVYFNANLSVASQVAYKPSSKCSELAKENNNLTNLRSQLNIPDSNYSNVSDILDALLCKFNADDLPIEKNEKLCKTLKDDASIITVQDAW
jgi:hypothetical protein